MNVAEDYKEHRENQRTNQQNKSLQLACDRLATVLNEAGLDQRTVLAESVDIPWTKTAVRHQLYNKILEVMTNKTSSADADTTEASAVWDVLCKHLATSQGIIPPSWPDRHGPIDQYYNGEDL